MHRTTLALFTLLVPLAVGLASCCGCPGGEGGGTAFETKDEAMTVDPPSERAGGGLLVELQDEGALPYGAEG